jgi:hypothetical protein
MGTKPCDAKRYKLEKRSANRRLQTQLKKAGPMQSILLQYQAHCTRIALRVKYGVQHRKLKIRMGASAANKPEHAAASDPTKQSNMSTGMQPHQHLSKPHHVNSPMQQHTAAQGLLISATEEHTPQTHTQPIQISSGGARNPVPQEALPHTSTTDRARNPVTQPLLQESLPHTSTTDQSQMVQFMEPQYADDAPPTYELPLLPLMAPAPAALLLKVAEHVKGRKEYTAPPRRSSRSVSSPKRYIPGSTTHSKHARFAPRHTNYCVQNEMPAGKRQCSRPTQSHRQNTTTRSASSGTLRWATMEQRSVMSGGEGMVHCLGSIHVALFAMHNAISSSFRDSLRIQALLRDTKVTHVSTMDQHKGTNCLGHNSVSFGQPTYKVLRSGCPPTVIWDYNWAFDGYILSNYGKNLFSEQVPGFFTCGANMVIIPNWGENTIRLFNGKSKNNTNSEVSPKSFADGMKQMAPTLKIKHIFISALQAQTHHPLVAATIAAAEQLASSSDVSARKANWSTQQKFIGVEQAFIVLYNVQFISDPLAFLRALSSKP